jgi:hypothetical protein
VLDGSGLTRKATADDSRDHVISAAAIGDVERLVDDQAQRRTGEVDLLLAAIDLDPARARLQPHARNGVLAAAGRIGAPELVELLLAQRSGLDGRRRRSGRSLIASSRSFGFRGRRRCGRLLGQLGEIGKGLLVGHYAPTLFLRFIDATSRT